MMAMKFRIVPFNQNICCIGIKGLCLRQNR